MVGNSELVLGRLGDSHFQQYDLGFHELPKNFQKKARQMSQDNYEEFIVDAGMILLNNRVKCSLIFDRDENGLIYKIGVEGSNHYAKLDYSEGRFHLNNFLSVHSGKKDGGLKLQADSIKAIIDLYVRRLGEVGAAA